MLAGARSALFVAVTVVAVAACNGIGRPLSSPEILPPEVVGVIVDWKPWRGQEGSYELDTGSTVNLNVDDVPDLPATRRLSTTDIGFEGRPVGRLSWLLLTGQDIEGRTWYAAAKETPRSDCPFQIQGDEIADQGDHLLFSSGLTLRKAAQFEVRPEALMARDDMKPPFPLSGADAVCLDSKGVAVAAEVWLDR